MEAIILCAGEGTRLRPITNHLAKPLVPVVCVPILEHILSNLEKHGIYRAAANIHHKQEDFFTFVENRIFGAMRFSLVPEENLLGAGGGISNIAANMKPAGPVLVHAGDIYTDVDFTHALRHHRAGGALITLLVRKGEPEIYTAGESVVDINGIIGNPADSSWKFTAISIWETDALKFLPRPGDFGNAIDAMIALISTHRGAVSFFDIGDSLWSDIGAPKFYLELHGKILGQTQHIGDGLELPPGVRTFGTFCACSGAEIGPGSNLKNVVVLDGGVIAPGSRLENAIVGPFGIIRI